MRSLFKIASLVLITLNGLNAQKHTFINQVFEVGKETIIEIDLKWSDVTIEKSPDAKVYIEYKVEFMNYPKKWAKNYKEKVDIKTKLRGNMLKISGRGGRLYDMRMALALGQKVSPINSENIYKTKDSLLKEVKDDSFLYLKKMFNFPINAKPRPKKNRKEIKGEFVIKVPSGVLLEMKAEDSKFDFKNISNQITLNIKRGRVRSDNFSNAKSKFYIKDAKFKVEKITGGTYRLSDVYYGLIGSSENADFKSDFSNIEIAEIGKNVDITDFNGKLWLYDFSSDFEEFNLKSDYSKVHLFYPKTDFGLKIMANNAVNVTIFSKKGKSVRGKSRADSPYVLMDKKAKGTGDFSGNMNLEIDNGFTFLYEEEYEQSKDYPLSK